MNNKTKKLFDVKGFMGDYFEEYKGYPFSVSLDLFGFRSVMIIFPKGVKIHEKYLNPKGKITLTKDDKKRLKEAKKQSIADNNIVSSSTWFTTAVDSIFGASEGDIYEVGDDRHGFLVRGLGLSDNPNKTYRVFIKDVDFERSYVKHKDFLEANPEAMKTFNNLRETNNKIEELFNKRDTEHIAKILPKGITSIATYDDNDAIELCRMFIDEILEHENKIQSHNNILNKISKTVKEKTGGYKYADNTKRKAHKPYTGS